MKPGEHPKPELCEVRGCRQHTFRRSQIRQKSNRQKWVCIYHWEQESEKVFKSVFQGRSFADIEREEAEYRRTKLSALERLIFDRELSFSEKVAQLDFFDR